MPSLRSYLAAGAALVALSVGFAHAADKADCINPPHPLLNWCAGNTAYSSDLSLNMTAVAKKLDFVKALGGKAADDEVVMVDNIAGGGFVSKLESKLREPSTGKVRFVEEFRINDNNHAFRALGIISPDVRDDIQVCFEAGPSKEARRLVAVFNIQPNGTVVNTTSSHSKFALCNEFGLAAKNEINKRLAETVPARAPSVALPAGAATIASRP